MPQPSSARSDDWHAVGITSHVSSIAHVNSPWALPSRPSAAWPSLRGLSTLMVGQPILAGHLIDSRGVWRPELQPEYTLKPPPGCPNRRGHLREHLRQALYRLALPRANLVRMHLVLRRDLLKRPVPPKRLQRDLRLLLSRKPPSLPAHLYSSVRRWYTPYRPVGFSGATSQDYRVPFAEQVVLPISAIDLQSPDIGQYSD